ncbi:malto-oligosyltrehalose synthase [Pedobacter agri]|uniref:malto-oligosyltrehalose synthase n=1 Tax=Pedobacter agri TaxID=454586 RepID=UPI00292EA7F3|nr:malto-oligosyltrehalose synthase [Pedobacter agri]
MFKPTSTYRIQFHKDFNFKSFKKIIPYLKNLGVDTIYASPIFEAVEGSMHGYDTINPHRINPEIGTEAELFEISKELTSLGISWLQDIVPNHMAFSPKNEWLMDVLKKGTKSMYSSFFDINIQDDTKLMVPFLGDDLDQVIENTELKIVAVDNEYYLNYGDSNWPLKSSSNRKLKNKNLKEINEKRFIQEIANEQYYRLCNWKETDQAINYRRFFTVNSLICLSIQEEDNFNLYHQYILDLVNKGIFQGLRIDHIDGLYDPKAYLNRLRKAVGENVYIVVEKILEKDEQMPADWPTQGNTGYDFLAMVNNLFTNQTNQEKFNQIYSGVTGKALDPSELIDAKKRSILFEHMQGELNNLFQLFLSLKLVPAADLDLIGGEQFKQGIAEMLIQMPVYRYYNYSFPLPEVDAENLTTILNKVGEKQNLKEVASILIRIFIKMPIKRNVRQNQALSIFYQRLMQFTGPLMAKGVEDTVMFTYNRFIGHSEVGDSPDAFGLSLDEFHSKMKDRQQNWPLSLNGSATHDTKRGEDFRARINVLTDLPEKWKTAVDDFIKAIKQSKPLHHIFESVHNNDAYLILQTILGVMPMPGEPDDDLQNRLAMYIEKALREAKKRSDWAEPNEEYEQLVKKFANQLINEKEETYQIITKILFDIADFGIINSLSQLILKFTCPGIPDLYQGSELWDFSLVDPDNRRPVDYKRRNNVLKEDSAINELWNERYSGEIKLWLTEKLLKFRKENEDVFASGEYIPLKVIGDYQTNILAFARKKQQKTVIVVVPVGLASITSKENSQDFDWLKTQIVLPETWPTYWKNILDDKDAVKDMLNEGILINQIFSDVQLGIIELSEKKNKRSAGILMHITSLPSAYGIGDFGKEAKAFIDFLTETDQKYWQLLPLNPTKKGNGYSPYSSNSSKAGNILLIDLEQLVAEELITSPDLESAKIPSDGKVSFADVEVLKLKTLHKAYLTFKKQLSVNLVKAFETFCEIEKEWLEDFSSYTAIKNHHQQTEWYNWPDDFKFRDSKTISAFENKYHDEINEVKWQQYVFFKQWHNLKDYANLNDISIIGDLPFYLDYDSVEVWSQPELFKLDDQLKPTHVAGVPPDYFNEKGQLWGMPVFNWDILKQNDYDWWIGRLKKNMEMYDLLRLDHFRAFSSFWEVPAADSDAINGVWQNGPGAGLFRKINSNFPNMPFIAEDLGEISDDVELLRDKFNLPGMKVLQFGFGADMVISPHIPHNFETSNCIAYSGTHDNNTSIGWFKNEIDEQTWERTITYLGHAFEDNEFHKEIIKLTLASSAKTAILPIQDVLGLGEESRMNIPGKADGNWTWRLDMAQLEPTKKWLKSLTEIYGRKK